MSSAGRAASDEAGPAEPSAEHDSPHGGLPGVLDRFQKRHTWAGFPIAVVYKFTDDFGSYLSALITYYAFVSLFPLLLLLSTVLSFVLAGNPHLQQQILDSALAQLPVVGDQLGDPRQLSGGVAGLVIGVLVSLYGGLGVAQALQYATNTAWAVPRNSRPNPLTARLRSLVLLGIVGLAVLGTTALSALGALGAGSMASAVKWLVVLGSVVVNTGVFILVFRVSTTRALSLRDVATGAVTAAVAWQLLQTFGVTYVGRVINGASATNFVFAVVLGLLAFLYLASVSVVLSIEINVVRTDRLYPRSLLTPFTDGVVLTRGDRRTYAGQANAQRSKGFETIDVSFERSPAQEPSAQEPAADAVPAERPAAERERVDGTRSPE